MIYITQGHEQGIGLEILFKSLICFSQKQIDTTRLSCYADTAEATLKSLKLNYKINKSSISIFNKELPCFFLKPSQTSQSLNSILECLKKVKKNDILINLPTTKEAFHFKDKNYNGHTEFYRMFYHIPELGMLFISEHLRCLVLSDHDPLSTVPTKLSCEFIIKKITTCLSTQHSMLKNIQNIIFAGINPHAGEKGLIGNEDIAISQAIAILVRKFPHFHFSGPYSGDTLFFQNLPETLLVYTFHDQGLGVFKSQNGLLGINATLGLPFLRFSVDHGTAFDLYQKNQANYQGAFYLFKTVFELDGNEK